MSLLDPAPSGSEGSNRDAGDGAEPTPDGLADYRRRRAVETRIRRWPPATALTRGRAPARRRIDSPRPAPPHGRAPASNLDQVRGAARRARESHRGILMGWKSPWVGPVSCDAAKHYAGSRGRGGHDGYWPLRLSWARLETTPARPWVSLRMEATRRPGRRASCSRIASVCRGWRRLLGRRPLGWMVSIDVRLPVDANMRR